MTYQGISEFAKRALTGVILVICFGGAYLHSTHLFSYLLLVVYIIAFTEWRKLVLSQSRWVFYLSFAYPAIPFVMWVYLVYAYRSSNFLLPLYPMMIAWTADTGGYALGKLFGKHKICPSISPGKSWEGLGGSFVGILILNYFMVPKILVGQLPLCPWNYFACITIYAALFTVVAFLGGTLMSYLKRKNNLKDTGSILPGHGGVLDRFDSVLPIIIMVWLVFAH